MKLRQICSATLLGLATLTATLATTATPAMAAEATSHPTVSPNRYLEMLSRDNAVLLLVDHQVGLLSGVRDTTVGELKHNVVALANAARALGVPVIVTATMPDGMWGPTMPELTSALPDVKVINRTVINAWDDPAVRAAIEKTGRKQLIIAGVSLEICASFPALSAKAAGYDARVVLDASGTFNEAKRTTGLQRLLGAGIPVTDYASAAVEMLRSNVDHKAHDVYSALDMPFATLVWQMQEGAKKS
ncbi:isochorismatase family protein [Aeromonas jandaei]|uniref:isochorismatase family protein n=1 Tax=Aeromonas jandaei TaxID=650 RepID=UPI003B9E4A22